MVEITNILEVEKYLENISAVIFDLDDTLYSEKDYVKSGFIAISDSFPKVENMYDKLWTAFENGEKAIDVVFKEAEILEDKDKALKIYRSHKPNDITAIMGEPPKWAEGLKLNADGYVCDFYKKE